METTEVCFPHSFLLTGILTHLQSTFFVYSFTYLFICLYIDISGDRNGVGLAL